MYFVMHFKDFIEIIFPTEFFHVGAFLKPVQEQRCVVPAIIRPTGAGSPELGTVLSYHLLSKHCLLSGWCQRP